MRRRIALSLLVASLALLTAGASARSTQSDARAWSQELNGLQVRLELVEKEKYGTRWLVPYLELRNVRNLMNPLQVNLEGEHLKVELVNADGVPVRSGSSGTRSGPVPQLGTISLPMDSSMRVSLECLNWGIPKDAPAMISTDSGAWVIGDGERGKVYLRATLTAEKSTPEWRAWGGELQTPPVKVDWK